MGFDINCGVRFIALEATVDDVPNFKKLAGRLAGRIPAGGSGKGGVDITTQNLQEILDGGAPQLLTSDTVDEDLASLESNGMMETVEASLSQRALERGCVRARLEAGTTSSNCKPWVKWLTNKQHQHGGFMKIKSSR